MSVPTPAIRAARRVLDGLLLLLIGLSLSTIVLARVLPAVTGGATFVVRGGSMEPAIHLGSVVLVAPVAAADLRVGDVVSLKVGPDRAVFTHRIVRVVPRADGLWLETKGDANAAADPSIVPATAVIGRATAWIPWAGYLVTLLGSIMGIALVCSMAGTLLAGAWVLESIEDGRRLRDVPVALPLGSDRPDGALLPEPRLRSEIAS